MPPSPTRLLRAEVDAHFDAARVLLREYAAALDVEVCFRGFEAELAQVDRLYAPPAGGLLLALDGDDVAGCVAVGVPASGGRACEMKRLYVRPAYRGRGLGRQLAEAAVAEGQWLGYRRMTLDTLEQMDRARALYGSLGFRAVAPHGGRLPADVYRLAVDL